MSQKQYSLDAIQAQRKLLQGDIDNCKTSIRQLWGDLFTPSESTTKFQRWANQAERVVAMYDGVRMGYKLFHRFNAYFRKRAQRQGSAKKKR